MNFIKSKKKGNNLVEYALLAALVGVVLGVSIYSMDNEILLNFFSSTFKNSNSTTSSIVLDPLTE